jgi:DNA-binding NarL/FixJ family response regulator
MTIRLLILLQERTFADALSTRLEAEQDIQIVAALHTPGPLPHLFARSGADVMVIDGDLPDHASLVLCEELSRHHDAPQVILLSHSTDPRRAVRAIEAGAVGWVRKDESLDRLIQVIRGVARGETWLPPDETGDVLRMLLRRPEVGQDDHGELLSALTPRERDVLLCLADGAGRHDVAERLHMSPNTVRTHVQNLMGKLGVHSTLEAVALTRSHLASLLSGHPQPRHTPARPSRAFALLHPEA